LLLLVVVVVAYSASPVAAASGSTSASMGVEPTTDADAVDTATPQESPSSSSSEELQQQQQQEEAEPPLDPTDPDHFERRIDQWTSLCARLKDELVPSFEGALEADREREILNDAIAVRQEIRRYTRVELTPGGDTLRTIDHSSPVDFSVWDCGHVHHFLDEERRVVSLHERLDHWVDARAPEAAADLVDEFRQVLVEMQLVKAEEEADAIAAMDDVANHVRQLVMWRRELNAAREAALQGTGHCGNLIQRYNDVVAAMTAGHDEAEAERHRRIQGLPDNHNLPLPHEPAWEHVAAGARRTLDMCEQHFANKAASDAKREDRDVTRE
jgi:hypothetical protein